MSVLSNDGKTWLTKLERIGNLSTSQKDIVFNNIGHILSVEMLMEIYEQLDGNKAIGIDGVTKQQYGENLNHNIANLITKVRKGTYKPKASRITQIPKDDGSTRPLAIACFEDKIIQSAVSKILELIFEPIFLPCSFGFRSKRSCHDALRALNQSAFKNWDGAIVEIDIKKYFNTIPHVGLLNCLTKRISDKRFLRLIEVLIQAEIYENGVVSKNREGCPQGSIVSPVLSNIYLHYVIDEWFNEIKVSHLKGRSEEIRYCDDLVFTFEHKTEAERFYKVLPKRLRKFGLEIHQDKSSLITSGHNAISRLRSKGTKAPTFTFLGFTCYWGKSRSGFWRLKYSSRADRFTSKLKGLSKFLMQNINTPDTLEIIKKVIKVVSGWINYHAISDNDRRVRSFVQQSKRRLRRWFNRRGRKTTMSWAKFDRIMKRVKFPES